MIETPAMPYRSAASIIDMSWRSERPCMCVAPLGTPRSMRRSPGRARRRRPRSSCPRPGPGPGTGRRPRRAHSPRSGVAHHGREPAHGSRRGARRLAQAAAAPRAWAMTSSANWGEWHVRRRRSRPAGTPGHELRVGLLEVARVRERRPSVRASSAAPAGSIPWETTRRSARWRARRRGSCPARARSGKGRRQDPWRIASGVADERDPASRPGCRGSRGSPAS